MHSRNLWHYDLHDDNVLVRSVLPDENLAESYEVKLIDFGSARTFRGDQPEGGTRSDYVYLAKHFYSVVAAFERTHEDHLSAVDRAFAMILRRIAHRLSDTNISRRDLAPGDVVRQTREALAQSSTTDLFPSFKEMRQQLTTSLAEPLGNTNALTLAPQDIALLFRDSLGWFTQMRKSEAVIVVGPRGCGKTMLLRYLSLASQARPRKNETTHTAVASRLSKTPYVGFMASCGELRTPFLRSSYRKLQENDLARAEDFCREFINAHFAVEVVRTVAWLHHEQLATISEEDLEPLNATVAALLGVKEHNGRGSSGLHTLIELVERKVISLSNLPEPNTYRPSGFCRDDVLLQLAKAIRTMPWAREKEAWFLLDDYSVTVLPDIAERAYNPVLFRLSDQIRVKISSEGDGPVLEDSLKRKYKEGREYTKVNLGEIYFRSSESRGQAFFEEILKARFEAVGKGSLDKLKSMLGEHPHTQGFGTYICDCSRPGDARFYGFGLLCRLCSGDVSSIIELMHLITRGRWETGSGRITSAEQDENTKRFAQRQLADLRRTPECGPHIYEFSSRLGNLLKHYLLASKGKPKADERLRIEVEGTGEFSPAARAMHDAILRHSVLIDGGSGKSRKGLPTRKLFFRRLFAPCFPFSPSRGACVPLTVEEYEA
jgi:energy-coupling factor transporter ATP-binding protein EcfA2